MKDNLFYCDAWNFALDNEMSRCNPRCPLTVIFWIEICNSAETQHKTNCLQRRLQLLHKARNGSLIHIDASTEIIILVWVQESFYLQPPLPVLAVAHSSECSNHRERKRSGPNGQLMCLMWYPAGTIWIIISDSTAYFVNYKSSIKFHCYKPCQGQNGARVLISGATLISFLARRVSDRRRESGANIAHWQVEREAKQGESRHLSRPCHTSRCQDDGLRN